MIIISPKVGEESAKTLADYLGVAFENPYETNNRDYTKYNVVFKYGFARKIKAKKGVTINRTESIEMCRDKIKTLELFSDTKYYIPHTLDKEEARKWLAKGTVVARNLVKGADGDGLTYCQTNDQLDKAPAKFYTKYTDHTHEFRVYVWRGIILSVYDKAHNDGFFKFTLFRGVEDQPQLVDLCTKVFEKTFIDFCGVDVLRDKHGKLYLLEINTAPVLFPYTVKKLATHLRKEIVK